MAEEFWKSSPFGVDSIFHPSWEEKQRLLKQANQQTVPAVSFKEKVPDIDLNTKTFLSFKIDGEYQIIGGERFDVEIITDEKNIEFTTKKWTSVERGWTLNTNVTIKKEGNYTIQFKVNHYCPTKLLMRSI